jgi:hypothetical protein
MHCPPSAGLKITRKSIHAIASPPDYRASSPGAADVATDLWFRQATLTAVPSFDDDNLGASHVLPSALSTAIPYPIATGTPP